MNVVRIILFYCLLHNITLIYCDQYVFSTCKKGYEKLLKYEILSKYTNFKFAYSRPGLITWKTDNNIDEFLKESSIIFLRSNGKSIISQVNNIQDIIDIGVDLKLKHNNKIRLHVFGREEEESCMRSDHPNEIIERKNRINKLRSDILDLDKSISTNENIFHNEIEAYEEDIVLDVCIGEEKDKLFIGEHVHLQEYRRSKYPNNLFQLLELPQEAPSRAYMKTEEAILSYNIPVLPNQNVLEIGSAPGGSVYNLLQRGLKVYGVDPCPSDRTHSPVIKRNSNFIEILSKLHNLELSQLPTTTSIQWLICDANISPEDALPHLQKIAIHYHNKTDLKGLIYTCKLNDDIFTWKPDRLITYLYNTRNLILNTYNKEIFTDVIITTIPSNKQEVLIYAKTKYI